MEKLTLSASPRKILGKKVKTLRAAGQIPANVYGKGEVSTAIAVTDREFRLAHKQAGETGVLYLAIEGAERPVLIHRVQVDPIKGLPLHVDFYQVNLKEKTTAPVPVTLVGENELQKRGEGLIIQALNEVEVEALPTDIPREFIVDASRLTEIGQSIKVGDLEYDRSKVTVLTDAEQSVLVMQTAEMEEDVVEAVPAEEGTEPEVISEEEAAARAEAKVSGEGSSAPAPQEAPAKQD
jgi:large subunit ribosomal protein L25